MDYQEIIEALEDLTEHQDLRRAEYEALFAAIKHFRSLLKVTRA